MAKKIFASPEEIEKFLQSAQAQLILETDSLKKRKFQSDADREITLKFKVNDSNDDRKVEILFTPKAWTKMHALVKRYSTEVEWHGVVKRRSNESFLIEDILIFPHEVTGTTVISNQQEYEEWLNSLDDETFNALRFHGHSHAKMPVSPSYTDMKYRKDVLNNFGTPIEGADDFYVFLITNKHGEFSGQVYDLKNNIIYTKDAKHNEIDVDVLYEDGDTYLSEFLAEAKYMVKEARPSVPTTTSKVNGVPTGQSCVEHTNYQYNQPRRGAKTTQQPMAAFDDQDKNDCIEDEYDIYSRYWGGK